MKKTIATIAATAIAATTYVALRPSVVVNPPPIPALVRDAIDPDDWHVVFPPGAITTNYAWSAQYATNLHGPWNDFGNWWDGDTNIVKMQPTLFLRVMGTTNKNQ